jgi:hypothetical protein
MTFAAGFMRFTKQICKGAQSDFGLAAVGDLFRVGVQRRRCFQIKINERRFAQRS